LLIHAGNCVGKSYKGLPQLTKGRESMNRNIFFLLLVAILTYSPCIEAKTYRWVEENGVLRFSDTPPPGMVVEAPAAPRSKSAAEEDPFERARASVPIRFELNGEIVDPEGNPLTDVTMTIEEHHFPPSSFEYENIRKESTVNGTFAVACTGCPIHSLRFRVPGYVSEESLDKAAKILVVSIDDVQKSNIDIIVSPDDIKKKTFKMQPCNCAIRSKTNFLKGINYKKCETRASSKLGQI
jgi:hypothetical protein